jgi:hypothetical protein
MSKYKTQQFDSFYYGKYRQIITTYGELFCKTHVKDGKDFGYSERYNTWANKGIKYIL